MSLFVWCLRVRIRIHHPLPLSICWVGSSVWCGMIECDVTANAPSKQTHYIMTVMTKSVSDIKQMEFIMPSSDSGVLSE